MKKILPYLLLLLGAWSCFTLGLYCTKNKPVEPYRWIITSLCAIWWFSLAINKFKVIFSKIELTYEQRITWFFKNHYEEGMELDIMVATWWIYDLDNFEWHGEIIKIPKYNSDLK